MTRKNYILMIQLEISLSIMDELIILKLVTYHLKSIHVIECTKFKLKGSQLIAYFYGLIEFELYHHPNLDLGLSFIKERQ
jgi:hypothetical protein